MSEDDDIRKVFEEGRADAAAGAPDFESVWPPQDGGAAANDNGIRWVAVAVAAVVCLAGGFWLSGSPSEPPAPVVAEVEVPGEDVSDAELLELAAWEEGAFATPTDFLLEHEGTLGGGFPTGLNEGVLQLDDVTMEL